MLEAILNETSLLETSSVETSLLETSLTEASLVWATLVETNSLEDSLVGVIWREAGIEGSRVASPRTDEVRFIQNCLTPLTFIFTLWKLVSCIL